MTADTYVHWSGLLRQTRLGVTPAELHGSITGFLCAGWGGRSQELLAALALEADAADDALHALIDRSAMAIAERLRSGQTVELLLPVGPLAVRANAMVDWSRGFLGGLGLTGLLDAADQTPAERDLLARFGHIAAMHLECADDEAAALDELLDFIRAGVRQLYVAHAPGRA